MLAYLVIGFGGLAVLAVWLRFIPPPHAVVLIRVRSGMVRIRRGKVKSHAKEQITDILQESHVKRGFIAVTCNDRVFFSRQIPSAAHQRLRNVLLNQWA